MRSNLSSFVEVLGVVLLAVAAFAWDWRAGIALVGLMLLIVGFLADAGEPE